MGDECGCSSGPSRPSARPRFARMGVSSLGPRPPMPYNQPLPLTQQIPPRPLSPPRMPQTVPGFHQRTPTSTRCEPCPMDVSSLERTLTNSPVKSPDFSKFGSTMEELSKLEFVEMQNIEDDLRDFHVKRRKLVFNIASISLTKARQSIKKAVSKMGL